MSKFARIDNSAVVEIANLPDGILPKDAFHADLASSFVACNDTVQQGWTYDGKVFSAPSAPLLSLADQKTARITEVDAKVSAILAAGAPTSGGLHIALDDSSRADMGSMATTAIAASSGAVTWPDSYKEGWISIENTRIPLAAPSDGLTLAASVGDYYARVRQNGRNLKDAIVASTSEEALNGIDLTAGWPVSA